MYFDSQVWENLAGALAERQRRNLTNFHGYKHAAVLIVFDTRSPEKLLLIKRSEHFGHHKGQFAFPGGIFEETDGDLTQTACREAEEEVGLEKDCYRILGLWDDYPVPTGFVITPVIACLRTDCELTTDTKEIEYAFWEDLTSFLRNEKIYSRSFELEGVHRLVWYFPTPRGEIWGATGAIIYDVLQFIQKLS